MQQPPEHLGRHRIGDLQAHRPLEAPTAQLHLYGGEQVRGLFVVDREIRVAGHAESVVLQHLHAGEQQIEMRRDYVLERHEARRVADAHPAVEHSGHLDPREAAPSVNRIAHQHRQVERQIRDERERMAGIHGQGCEHRQDAALEMRAQVVALGGVQLLDGYQVDALGGKSGPDALGEQALLFFAQFDGGFAYLLELLLGGEPVDAEPGYPRGDPVGEARDADLEELVEVRREDRQEGDALEQRNGLIRGQSEHAGVERQPRQLPVEILVLRLAPAPDAHRRGRGGRAHDVTLPALVAPDNTAGLGRCGEQCLHVRVVDGTLRNSAQRLCR